MWLDYLILALYALSLCGIALYTRGRASSVDDFLLAGKRGLGGWLSAFSYGTTYFSAVIFIGYAGNFGKQYGLAAVWIGIGNALLGALLAWWLLAKRTKNMTVRLNAKTMPDFFEKRYESPTLKLVSAIVIFLFLIPYSASVYNGLSSLFEIVFDIPGWIVMVALAALTAVYLFFGGYFASALSDFIQGIIMLGGVVLMVLAFLKHPNVSFDLSALTSDPEHAWFTFGSENRGLYGNTVSLLSLILLTSFGVYALPQTIHKYYAIRDKRAIMQGMVVSTVFALVIGFGAYFVGALSPLFPTLADIPGDRVVPHMLALVIPAGLTGVIAILILSASMSTLSSVSLASASVVAVDIYKGRIRRDASDRRTNTVMRIFCLVFIGISLLLAILNTHFGITAIAYMMGISWGTLAGCFIGPYVLGLVWRRVSRPAVFASIFTSLGLTVSLIILLGYGKHGFACSLGAALKAGIGCSPMIGVIAMAASLIVTAAVSLLTAPPSDAALAAAFEKEIENEIK